jgi:hypothetical protein
MSCRHLIHALLPVLATGILLAACASSAAVPTTAPVEPTPVVETVAPGTTALAGTQVIRFDPSSIPADPNQTPVNGTCAASERVPRTGAYRCITETGGTFDPCFTIGPGVLGCQPNPMTQSWAAVLQASGALPETKDTSADPVAFYLDLGSSYPPCTVGTTAPKELNGQPVTYTCQAPGAWILGPLDTSTAAWMAQYVTTDSQGQTVTSGPTITGVAQAWTY